VAIAKILGIETEFGIVIRGVDESNPIAASSLLINSYLHLIGHSDEPSARNVGWDFEDESPGNDARGLAPYGTMAPEVETHLVNAVLTNGARYYVDHAHPELSTPECADARAIVVFDRAAEEILIESMRAASDSLPVGQELVIYKNNSDGKGNSYGCHENYLVDRKLPFARIVANITPHFITRQLFTGAGKVGSEAPGVTHDQVPFQLTQRADFFEEPVGLETTLKRPIVNTRDEPHCDSTKYRRLHVIVGDANLSEVATFLKVGTTAIVLAMIEDDALPRQFTFASPVSALRQVSYDLTLNAALEMNDGSTIRAIEIQWELLEQAKRYADTHGLACVNEGVGADIMKRWEMVLSKLESDPLALADQIDWIAKYRVLSGYRERHDLQWDDARLAAMDLQYHDLRPEKSLFSRLGMERITNDTEVATACTEPPTDTRAYFRGKCLQRWPDEIVAANWDSVVFDLGGDSLRRVPMMEPSRGTEAHVGTLLATCTSAAELLDRLDTRNS